MSYIFWKLLVQRLILATIQVFWSILRGVRILLTHCNLTVHKIWHHVLWDSNRAGIHLRDFWSFWMEKFIWVLICVAKVNNQTIVLIKFFLVIIWKFTPVLVWLKALVRIHNLIQECLMFWFFWSDETHGDAEILGMQIWNFRYANMDFFKTPHIQIWFPGKDPVFKYDFLVSPLPEGP